jgi:hypothetical protein
MGADPTRYSHACRRAAGMGIDHQSPNGSGARSRRLGPQSTLPSDALDTLLEREEHEAGLQSTLDGSARRNSKCYSAIRQAANRLLTSPPTSNQLQGDALRSYRVSSR